MEIVCTCCNIEKHISMFSLSKTGKNGRQTQCKKCLCEKQKDRYRKNTEQHINKKRKYRIENKDKISNQRKVKYSIRKDNFSKLNKENYEKIKSNENFIEKRTIRYAKKFINENFEINNNHKLKNLVLLKLSHLKLKRELRK